MRLLQAHRVWLLALTIAALAGCGQLLIKRDTSTLTGYEKLRAAMSESVAVGYVTITQLRGVNTELIDEGRITSWQASEVRSKLDDARRTLDAASATLAQPGGLKDGNAQLQTALAAIAAARSLLVQ